MPIKTVEIQMPDGSIKEVDIEMPEVQPARSRTPREAEGISGKEPSATRKFFSAAGEALDPRNIPSGIKAAIPYTQENLEATGTRLRARENPLGALAEAVTASPVGQFGGASAGQRYAEGDKAGGLGELAGTVVGNTALEIGVPAAIRLASRPAARVTGKAVQAAASPQKTMKAVGQKIESFGGATSREAQLAGLPDRGGTGNIRIAPPRKPVGGNVGVEPIELPADPMPVDRYMPNRSAAPESRLGVEPVDVPPSEWPYDTTTEPLGRAASPIDEAVTPEIDLTEAVTPETVPAGQVASERAAERFGRRFVDEGATTPEGQSAPGQALIERPPSDLERRGQWIEGEFVSDADAEFAMAELEKRTEELRQKAEAMGIPRDKIKEASLRNIAAAEKAHNEIFGEMFKTTEPAKPKNVGRKSTAADLPQTKSKSRSTLDDRLSPADLKDLGERLAKGIPLEEAVAQMEAERKLRHRSHYESAKLDKQARAASDRDR